MKDLDESNNSADEPVKQKAEDGGHAQHAIEERGDEDRAAGALECRRAAPLLLQRAGASRSRSL